MYDVIVVGARVAGSPTAMLLAQKGYKVLLLDRDEFPSDTISTHILLSRGFSYLRKWGLADQVLKTNAPRLNKKLNFDLGPIILSGSPPAYNGTEEIIAPRRFLLDKILVVAAVTAGAELRENCSVEELLFENDRVAGVRYKTKDGKQGIEKARMVIGADGKNSVVARQVKAAEYNTKPKMSCWYYTYWSGVPIKELTMHSRPNRNIGVIPTNDNLVCMPISWPISEFHTYRSDIEGNYMRSIEQVESLRDLMVNAKREERFTGMADLPGFFRQSFGPGWALVGDAAYHKDPVTGLGISDSLQRAETLTEAIDAGFSGREPLAEALEKYQQDRDRESMGIYELTAEWASFAPPNPEMEVLFGVLATNQEETNRFIGTFVGSVPVNEFFAPENLERIIGATVLK